MLQGGRGGREADPLLRSLPTAHGGDGDEDREDSPPHLVSSSTSSSQHGRTADSDETHELQGHSRNGAEKSPMAKKVPGGRICPREGGQPVTEAAAARGTGTGVFTGLGTVMGVLVSGTGRAEAGVGGAGEESRRVGTPGSQRGGQAPATQRRQP